MKATKDVTTALWASLTNPDALDLASPRVVASHKGESTLEEALCIDVGAFLCVW